jgi:hypothetical protein
MRLDLQEAKLASRIDLFFDLWLKMPPGTEQGLFIHLIVPTDGGTERVPVFGGTATSGVWSFPPRRLDLMNLTDIGAPGKPIDLRGGVWYLQWTGYAPDGAPTGGGIYIDNVSLVWEPDPAVPTPTPWLTDTPTVTPTPSATGTRPPTATRTPTPEPVVHALYAPIVRKDPRPTATPTSTASITPEQTATSAASGTPGTTPGTPGPTTPGPGTPGGPGTATLVPATRTPGTDTTTPPVPATASPTPALEVTETPTPGMQPTPSATRTPLIVETLPPLPTP